MFEFYVTKLSGASIITLICIETILSIVVINVIAFAKASIIIAFISVAKRTIAISWRAI
jgi:hypothetical protein